VVTPAKALEQIASVEVVDDLDRKKDGQLLLSPEDEKKLSDIRVELPELQNIVSEYLRLRASKTSPFNFFEENSVENTEDKKAFLKLSKEELRALFDETGRKMADKSAIKETIRERFLKEDVPLKEILEHVRIIKSLSDEIEKYEKDHTVAHEVHTDKVLEGTDCLSRSEINSHVKSLREDIEMYSGNWLKRKINKSKIAACRSSIEHLSDASKELIIEATKKPDRYKIEREESDERELIASKLKSLVVKRMSAGIDAMKRADMPMDGKDTEYFHGEILANLKKKIEATIASDRRAMDIPPETVAECLEIAKQALQLENGGSHWNDSYQLRVQIDNKIPGNYSVQNEFEHVMRREYYFTEIINFINNAPFTEETKPIIDAYKKCLDDLKGKRDYLYDVPADIRKLGSKITDAEPSEIVKNALDHIVNDGRDDLHFEDWDRLTGDPLWIERLGKEKIKYADNLLKREAGQYLRDLQKEEEEHQERDSVNKRERIGAKFIRFHTEEDTPLVVMNMYRDYGYNSPVRTMKVGTVKLLQSLSAETLERISASAPAGFMEAVNLIRANPEDFDHVVRDKDFKEVVGVSQEVDKFVGQMALHYLGSADVREQIFAACTLQGLSTWPPEAYEVIKQTLLKTQDQKLTAVLVKTCEARYDDPDSYGILLENFDVLSPTAKEKIRDKIPSILSHLVVTDHESVKDGFYSSLSAILGLPSGDIKRTLAVLYKMRQVNYSHRIDDETIVDAIKMSAVPGALEFLISFIEMGYSFKSVDKDALLEALPRASQVLSDYTFVNKLYPSSYLNNVIKEGKLRDAFEYFSDQIRYSNSYYDIYVKMEELVKSDTIDPVMMRKATDVIYVLRKDSFGADVSSEQFYAAILDTIDRPEKIKELRAILVDESIPESIRGIIKSEFFKLITMPDALVKIKIYTKIASDITRSPSQEIQRLREPLLRELISADDPVARYAEIENVFIKNNLPIAGRVYAIFEILYPTKKIEAMLSTSSSPVLKGVGPRRRSDIFYKDLLNVHIKSANRSLLQYIQFLTENEGLLSKVESIGPETLNSSEKKKLKILLDKFDTLFENSSLIQNDGTAKEVDLKERYEEIKKQLSVKEGQTLHERIAEMFLKPLNIDSLEEVKNISMEAIASADKRNRAQVEDTGGHFDLSAGDLLKGINDLYIENILQNGSVAREFLGADSASDATPFDTDVSMISEQDGKLGFAEKVDSSIARSYGKILFAIRDRGQFQHTKSGEKSSYEPGKFELFKTSVAGERHYGIRTGFPATEIDFIIEKGRVDDNVSDRVCHAIAENGYYVPIVNDGGEVIFTPQQFDEYRKIFSGLERFGGGAFVFEAHDDESIKNLKKEVRSNSVEVEKLNGNIRSEIESALKGSGITLKEEYSASIIGAELVDTGSTGRKTNLAGSFDFDFSLKLDEADFLNAAGLSGKIGKLLVAEEVDVKAHQNGYYQLRAKNVTGIGEAKFKKPIDIDIGFTRKSDLAVFGSHDAVREKLTWIESHIGKDAYETTIANILLAKEKLKEDHAYKKLEDGGLGGIGVENWILAHHGNIEQAFRSFRDAAYVGEKQLPLDEFAKKYKIIDPGVNVKFLRHDNFIQNLKPEGYKAMLEVIDKFLTSNKA